MEKLFLASATISDIKINVIVTTAGIRKILLNRISKPETEKGIEEISIEHSLAADVFNQLKEYLDRRRKEFNLQLDIIGTDFQKKVWKEIMKIPYGETITYNQLAINLGNKKSIRAAAAANGANPIPIIIPCHRVIGSDGNLVGYSGGLEVKQKLLELEGSRSLSLFRKY